MTIAISVAPRLLLSQIRALTSGTFIRKHRMSCVCVLNYFDKKLKETEVYFSRTATFLTDQASLFEETDVPFRCAVARR